MTSAATEPAFTESPRPTIAPETSSIEASNTISWPAPNPAGSIRLPCLPPMALAQPPPLSDVVSHGIHALAATIAAHSATSQPGRRRRCMISRLAGASPGNCESVAGRGESTVGGVLGVSQHRATVVGGHLERVVDNLGAEEHALSATAPARGGSLRRLLRRVA